MPRPTYLDPSPTASPSSSVVAGFSLRATISYNYLRYVPQDIRLSRGILLNGEVPLEELVTLSLPAPVVGEAFEDVVEWVIVFYLVVEPGALLGGFGVQVVVYVLLVEDLGSVVVAPAVVVYSVCLEAAWLLPVVAGLSPLLVSEDLKSGLPGGFGGGVEADVGVQARASCAPRPHGPVDYFASYGAVELLDRGYGEEGAESAPGSAGEFSLQLRQGAIPS